MLRCEDLQIYVDIQICEDVHARCEDVQACMCVQM